MWYDKPKSPTLCYWEKRIWQKCWGSFDIIFGSLIVWNHFFFLYFLDFFIKSVTISLFPRSFCLEICLEAILCLRWHLRISYFVLLGSKYYYSCFWDNPLNPTKPHILGPPTDSNHPRSMIICNYFVLFKYILHFCHFFIPWL